MPNIIKHKRNSTAGLVPGTGSIDQAELAINIADGKLYTKDSSNSIINLGVSSISGTDITPNSGNFTNSLQVNGTGVSISGHSHISSDITDFNSSVSGLLPTITNSGNNRILTSTGSSVGINAESNLTFNDTNNRLGINTASPTQTLHVNGNGLVSSGLYVGSSPSSNSLGLYIRTNDTSALTQSFLIQDSSFSKLFEVRNNGNAQIGNLTSMALSHRFNIKGSTDPSNGSLNVVNSGDNPLFFVRNDGKIYCGGTPTNGIYPQFFIKNSSNSINDSSIRVESNFSDIFELKNNGNFLIGGNNSIGGSANSSLGIKGTTSNSSSYAIYSVNSGLDPLFVVKNDGTVGIGMTSPTSTLQVSGLITSNSGNFTNSLRVNDTEVSLTGHSHTSANITNFNSSVSGLLPTITNSGDNRLLTSTGSSVGVNAEEGLTFDGSTLNVVGLPNIDPSAWGDGGIITAGIKSGPTTISLHSYASNSNFEGGSWGGGVISLLTADSATSTPTLTITPFGFLFGDSTVQNTAWIGSVTSSQVTDFNSAVSGLLPVKNIVAGTNITITSSSGTYTINSSGGGGGATTVSNYTDNRVITSDGTPTGLNAETNFTFNDNLLSITGSGSFSNNVTASGFVRSGGTSSQFLKGDGSVDSTAYTTNVGTVTSVAALTLGTTGTDVSSTVVNDTTSPVITLNIPTASSSNRGALSSTDWTIFNNKQTALSNPVTGTGVASHIAYWTSSSETAADTGQLYWDSTNHRLGIGTETPTSTLQVSGSIVSNSGTFGNLLLSSNNLSSTSGNIIITPGTTGSLQRDSAGDPRGIYAVDWQSARSTGTMVAAGNHSIICGGVNNYALGSRSVVVGGGNNSALGNSSSVNGGNTNTCIGIRSTIGGGVSNTGYAENSTIGGGAFCVASGLYSVVGGGNINYAIGNTSTVAGGNTNSANGDGSFVGGGLMNIAGGFRSTVGGGSDNNATGRFSTIVGGDGAKATNKYEVAHAAKAFVNAGDAQHTILMAKVVTSGSAPTNLFTEASGDRLTIPADKTTWTFGIKISAYNDTDNLGAGWDIRGCIQRYNNITTLIGTNVVNTWIPIGMSGVTASAIAAAGNNALTIQVVGLASKNIRWVGVVDISQVSWGVI